MQASAASAEPLAELATPGATVAIDAIDAAGVWGSITVTRREDTGGYPDNAVDPDSFIIEIFIEYAAERLPAVTLFGRRDWMLVARGHTAPIGIFFSPVPPPNPADFEVGRQELYDAPGDGAVDLFSTPAEGMLYFQVPREAADLRLELLYRPEGIQTPLSTITVREPGPAPAPVPTATPVPTAAPVIYVDQPPLPFTVVDSPAADGLFAEADTCANPAGGFTVTYPDSWYTNTAFGDVPPCSWFAPKHYEVTSSDVLPAEVVIVITVFPGPLGHVTQPDYDFNEAVVVDGFSGRQQVGESFPAGGHEAQQPRYEYIVVLGTLTNGRTVHAVTSSEGHDDYVLNKAVLDRIMGSFQINR